PPCVTLEACFQPVSVCRIPGLGHGLWSQAGKVTWAFIDALK
ncbi:MAG: phospholipase/Carboxylesterase, partial [Myxococcaceae bacterium]|nr:phospholipase/Carboxylesterase [Myxococcaceae bacterium]